MTGTTWSGRANTGRVRLFAICQIYYSRYISMCSTKQYMYKTKYALIHHSRTYTNVYIGIWSTYIYVKSHFNRKAFIKARATQSVEYRATNLKVVGSSPTVSKNFSFCILSLSMRSWQVNWSHKKEIKAWHSSEVIGAQRELSFERKNGGGTSS